MKKELIRILKSQIVRLQRKAKVLEGLARGEKAILDGSVVSHDDAKKRMYRWLKNN